MKIKPTVHIGSQTQLVWFGFGIAALFALVAFVTVPTLGLGFVADDFFLLINDQKLPLTESADQLHRPLRNLVLRVLGNGLGLTPVEPYRVLVLCSFFAVLVLFFLLLRRLGIGLLGSLTALWLLAFFPRNQEVLYWFAAWQDLAAAAAILATCVGFLAYRQTQRPYALWLAVVSYAVALGFKETSVFLPVVLLSLDLFLERQPPRWRRRAFWRTYGPFGCVAALYLFYFLADAGVASLAGHRTGGFYKFPGVRYVISGLLRSLANIALMFSEPFTLASLRAWQLIMIVAEYGILVALARWLRQVPALLLATSWFACLVLPTAVFAAAANADRYLFVPTMGLFLLVAFLVEALVARPRGATYCWVAISTCLALYAALAVPRLVAIREQWRSSGAEASTIVKETVSLLGQVSADSNVYFVNLTHSQTSNRPVFANGLSEALHANGFPLSARIQRNFFTPDRAQESLVGHLTQCPSMSADLDSKTMILMEVDGHIRRLNPACAYPLVDQNRSERPLAWDVLFPLQ